MASIFFRLPNSSCLLFNFDWQLHLKRIANMLCWYWMPLPSTPQSHLLVTSSDKSTSLMTYYSKLRLISLMFKKESKFSLLNILIIWVIIQTVIFIHVILIIVSTIRLSGLSHMAYSNLKKILSYLNFLKLD